MTPHTVFLGADHGGFALKQTITELLKAWGYQVIDCGAHELDPADDYPQFAFAVAEQVAQKPDSRGILICRSGGGVAIAANKVRGIRAAQVWNPTIASHAAAHDGAQVIAIAADWLGEGELPAILKAYLETELIAGERHQRRLDQIAQYEAVK